MLNDLRKELDNFFTNSKAEKQRLLECFVKELSDCYEPIDICIRFTRIGYSISFTTAQDLYRYVNYHRINEMLKVHNLPIPMERKDYEVKVISALSELVSRKLRYA